MNRRLLLAKIDQKLKKAERYSNLIGPGFRKKIKRFLLLRRKYLVYSFLRITQIREEVLAELFWDKRIVLPIKDPNALYLYYFGCLNKEEAKLTKFLIKNLGERDVFYDVGASYGFYTFLAENIINSGEVHVFEPHPLCASYLEKNISKESNTTINIEAVYSEKTSLPLFGKDAGYHKGSSGSSLIKNTIDKKSVRQLGSVQTVVLDDYIKHNKKPTFIKLDIEGGEYNALLGAKKLLTEANPIISMEVWGGEKGEKFSKRAVELLYSIGYNSYRIDDEGDIKKEAISFQEIESGFDNFIFKK